MSAVLLKELKAYFRSLFGWIYLAVFIFFEGAFFIANNIYYGSPYISNSLSGMVLVVIFLFPLLTMRIIAEEKRQKTDQFLITAPVPLISVVIGKYLSLVVIMLISTLICSVGVGVLAIYGQVPVLETIIALGGFFLLGCECMAIGMFLSSITEHQFLAAIFTYAVYFFTLIVPGFFEYIFGNERLATKVVKIFDIYAPFDEMLSGVFKVSNLLYLLSVIAVFLILAYKVFAKNSVQLAASGKYRFFFSSFLPFLIIAGIVGLNIGVKYIPSKYTEFDVTKNKYYSITKETKEVLDSLEEDVTIYVIASKESVDTSIKQYVNSYDSYSKHIKVEYKPTSQYPGFAKGYTDDSLYPSSLIIEQGDNYRIISYYDMFETVWDYSGNTQVTGFDIEGQITAAIDSILSGDNNFYIYCLGGHSEVALPARVTSTLQKRGFKFKDFNLYDGDVPEDCDILVINCPQSDLNKNEIESVKRYINKGGKVFMTSAFENAECKNYDEFTNWFGLEITEGTVLEGDYRFIYPSMDPTYIINLPLSTSLFEIGSNKMNLFYGTRGFKYESENLPSDIEVYDIYITSSDAYAKHLDSQAIIDKEEGDEEGPFSLGVYIKKHNQDAEDGEVVLIASPSFLIEVVDESISYGNSDLFIDAAKKLVDSSVVTTIPTKSLNLDLIMVSPVMRIVYLSIYCILAPVICIVAGLVIFIARKIK